MKRRFMTRESLDELAENMPIISFEEQESYYGSNDTDCFWRCVAYLASGGQQYDEYSASCYAIDYLASTLTDPDYTMQYMSQHGGYDYDWVMHECDIYAYMNFNTNIDYSRICYMGNNHAVIDFSHLVSGSGYLYYDPQNDSFIDSSQKLPDIFAFSCN